ncbi:MAG: hypothetical protein HBSAPP03_06890 [Phycisphaerae bacterium]|nr:MAG: hypothetical protein HBSAPP03_06890 [Phycisphaerae bacterium]
MDHRADATQARPATEDLSQKRVFTTGEAASVCKVSQQTIIRCFDAGRLHGFRVPGSKFRRIPREELLRFMRANDIPTAVLESGSRRRILCVDDDEQILALYRSILTRDTQNEVRTATTAYDAGLLTESFRPQVILLDFMLPDVRGDVVCARVRENPAFAATRVLAVTGHPDPGLEGTFRSAGAHGFLRKPFTTDQLLEAIAGVLVGAGVPAEHGTSRDGAR